MPVSDFRTQVEIRRLARVLGCEAGDLTGLAVLSPADVRVVSERASDHLLEAGRPGFERVVALAGRLPASLSASLAQRVLGPALGARAAALLERERAVDLASRVSAEYLTEVAVRIDTRHVSDLVARIPPATVAEVARSLARRRAWIAMGDLVGHLSAGGLAAALDALSDKAILRTSPYVEDSTVDDVIDRLGDDRLAAMAELDGFEQELADIRARAGGSARTRLSAAYDAGERSR